MIHIIYITLILNALITGNSIDSFKSDFDGYKYILAIVAGLLFGAPYAILFLLYEFLKLCWQGSWLGSIVYVAKVNLGFVQLTQDGIEFMLQQSSKKQKQLRLSVKDKIYIWGAKSISNYYYKHQHKTS